VPRVSTSINEYLLEIDLSGTTLANHVEPKYDGT